MNWLEVETTSRLVGRIKAINVAEQNFIYSGLYKIVLNDFDALSDQYQAYSLQPIRDATLMTGEDLAFAARMDEFVLPHN